MKTALKLLTVFASVSISSTLMAQSTPPGSIPFSLSALPFKEMAKPKPAILSDKLQHTQEPFSSHLPSILPHDDKKLISGDAQNDPAIYYGMPVVKPGKTSKILIAGLDAKHPYTYNMPVKKLGATEKK